MSRNLSKFFKTLLNNIMLILYGLMVRHVGTKVNSEGAYQNS